MHHDLLHAAFFPIHEGDSALCAAVRLLPFICFFIFFVMVVSTSLPVISRHNLYYLIGGSLIVAGYSLLYTIDTTTPNSDIYGYEILVMAGIGLCWQNAYAAAVVNVPSKDSSKPWGL
jgi:hypothetical protein